MGVGDGEVAVVGDGDDFHLIARGAGVAVLGEGEGAFVADGQGVAVAVVGVLVVGGACGKEALVVRLFVDVETGTFLAFGFQEPAQLVGGRDVCGGFGGFAVFAADVVNGIRGEAEGPGATCN